MKCADTPCPANHRSHDSPAGTITLALPTAMISTRLTESGMATLLGNLTAWLLLLLKSVV